MVKSETNYLRIYKEEPPRPAPRVTEGPSSLPEVLKAFQQATGWSLQYSADAKPSRKPGLTWSAPVNPGVGATPGHLRPKRVRSASDDSRPPADVKAVRGLASALGGMLGELLGAQHALWQREAELAVGVPLVPHPKEEQHLAVRLEAVLRGGAQAVGCQAAALYLLDDATTCLKLRSSWGLPRSRLAGGPRALEGALADLEAMLGHAVVLEDAKLLAKWNPPEDFPACVCVPVASSTNILGTLWVFSSRQRGFDEHETNIIEVVAGRVASDLEREILLREGLDGAHLKRQLTAAERMQRSQLPVVAPLLDGWDVAGWTEQSQPVGGDFFDWFALPCGRVAVAVGDVGQRGIEAALSAGGVRAALRSHGQYHDRADRLLEQVNLTLWTGSAGDQWAALFCGLLETANGEVRFASAGEPGIVLVRPDGWESLGQTQPPIGESPETSYKQQACHLRPGEALVVFTDGFRDARDDRGKPLGEAGVAEPLMARLDLPAQDLVTIARDRLEAHAPTPKRDDRTVMVVKRTDP